MSRLVLILGDQLTHGIAALRAADRSSDLVVMAEVMDEATYVPHHPKKIAFLIAAMRKFAAELRQDGWQVAYAELDDPANTHSITAELLRHAAARGAREILATQPGEWRLIAALGNLPVPVHQLPDDRYLCSGVEFATWAKGRKTLRMEYFYREMRRKTGLLMAGDQPLGGKWNFDHDNRKPAQADLFRKGPLRFEPDETTRAVLALVAARFSTNFGDLTPFWFATDRAGALAALTHFITHALPGFGETQDAMLQADRFLNHAVLSPYLNAGLLTGLEVCRAAAAAYQSGHAPLNAVEGFIRQIIGWREFLRGVYFLHGPSYVANNALNHSRPLPGFYWGQATRMNCIAQAVAQTRAEAYAHHIQRLMITGNFALLAGVDPAQVHQWYLAVYADAYEWVEAPNVIGMSQFADGGVVASKPYVSSGAYINRMSDYCGACHYRVKDRTGPRACPFNLLYWDFLSRHRDRFAANPRMRQMYHSWDKMAPAHRETVLAGAQALLGQLDRGALV